MGGLPCESWLRCQQEAGRRQVKFATLEKNGEAEGRTFLWVDETGFYLLPARIRTYAPRGQTPILRVPLTRDHRSVIGAVTPTGRLLRRILDAALRGPDVVAFLRQLLRQVPGQLLVLWDGAPIHRAQPVKDFLASRTGKRLRLVPLPRYAPDTNGAEGIWQHLKRVQLRNVCCGNLLELQEELRLAARRLRRKPTVIQGCIRQAGYQV